MAFDQSLVGKEFEATAPVTVSAEAIAIFCRALGEDSGRYGRPGPDGSIIAPPSFAVTFRNTDAFFNYTPRFGRGFDAGKEVEFIGPIHAGDEITLTSTVREMYEKTGRSGTMTFVILRSTLTNQHGETVAHVDHRFVHRNPGQGE
ncbi:MAG TPA: MaoC family dehydratase N-terminal domain-containing protein [Candidatus Binataceae bacterium]|jgi:N-terminal half of MaoC dehydratase|nr:MaoC family dehydratase N-terminal domain-containing protein [Candidatus Binataceae bacterium]